MTFWVAGAAIVGGVGGALISSKASGNAADTQLQASRAATAEQGREFDWSMALQKPWLQAGRQGLNALLGWSGLDPNNGYLSAGQQDLAAGGTGSPSQGANLLTPYATYKPFTMADYQADPGYQFRLDQGMKGLTAAANASGGWGSGKYLKDAMKFNSNLASQEYGAAYGRYNQDWTTGYNEYTQNQSNIWNRLASVAGIGQSTAQQMGTQAQAFGNQVGSNIIGGANAVAAGQVGSANAWNNAIGQGVSLYNQNQMLNRFYPQGGGGTPPNPYAYGVQPRAEIPTYQASPMGDWYSAA